MAGRIDIYKECDKEVDALYLKTWYMQNFPPGGYDTSIDIFERDGKWIVRGYMYSSCD